MKRYSILIISLVVLIAAGAAYWFLNRESKAAGGFETATVSKGDVQVTITSTGTVEPQEAVDVGAQVAGLILAFGPDPHDATKVVDYDTQVDVGTVLAKIDTSLYQSQVDQGNAALALAKANVEVAQANVDVDKAKLADALADWDRAQKLGPSEALAKSEYDSFQAVYETAKATVTAGNAAITQAQANVAEAQANLDSALRNLGYCTITSPVKGVVIDRRVNIGQTVVSSLNTPSLFLIATDLTKIEVWVSVNEADIGKIHAGMTANFSVDAFPDRTFHGEVGKIRLNATMTQNVVTYTVEVNADNTDGTLLPYLTATVQFLVDQRTNVLVVPNSALRWRPRNTEEPVAEAEPAAATNSTANTTAQPAGNATAGGPAATGTPGQRGQGRRGGRNGGSSTSHPSTKGTVYVVEDGKPKAVSVRTGLTDGVSTEIVSGLTEGQEVILGENSSDSSGGSGTTNPFAPQFFRGGGGGGGNRRGG
jgi:HlyD family secretion protein